MAEEVVIKITAKDDASKVLNQIAQSMGRLSGSKGMGGVRKQTAGVGMSFGKMAGAMALGNVAAAGATVALQAIGKVITGTIGGLIAYGDAWQGMSNRLLLFAKNADHAADIQEKLFDVAQATRQQIGPTTELYQRFAMANETLGLTQEELFQITTNVSQAVAISGATASSSAAAMVQLGQGMASGVLGGDELRSVMENTTGVAQALADGMGITIGELRKFRKNGGIAAEEVAKALLKTTVTGERFSKVIPTFSVEMVRWGNVKTKVFGKLSSEIGMNRQLGEAVQFMSKTMMEMDFGPITNGFKQVMAAIALLLPGGEAATGFFTTITSVWIPGALRFTMGFINGIRLIIDTFSLLWDTGKLVVSNFANIDWGKILMALPKIFFAHMRGMLRFVAEFWANSQKMWEKGVNIVMSLFDVNFMGLWKWLSASFKKFVVGGVVSAADWMLTNVISRIPGLGDKFKKFRDSVSSTAEELNNTPIPSFDFSDEFSKTGDALGEFGAILADSGKKGWEAYKEEIGNAGEALFDIADAIDPTGELRKRFEDLKEQGSTLFDPLAVSADAAVEGQKEVADEAEKTAGRIKRAWDATFEGIKSGIKSYKEELGKWSEDIAGFVKGTFEDVETGLTDAIGIIIFGDDKEKVMKDVVEDLGTLEESVKKFREFVNFDQEGTSTAGVIVASDNFGRAIDTMLNKLSDMESSDIPKKFQDRIGELRETVEGFQLGALTDEEISAFLAAIDQVSNDIENDTGRMGRFKRAGKALKSALMKGMEEEVPALLARALMRGVWSAVTSQAVKGVFGVAGKKAGGAVAEGMAGEMSMFDKFWTATKDTFLGLGRGLKSAFEGAGKKLDKFWTATKDTFSGLKGGIKDAFEGAGTKLNKFWTATKMHFRSLKGGIANAFEGAGEKLNKFWTAGVGTFRNLGAGLKSAFGFATDNLNKFWNYTAGTFDTLKEAIVGVFSPDTKNLDKFFDADAESFKGMGDGLDKALGAPDTSRFDKFFSPVEGAFNALKSGLEGAFDISLSAFDKFFETGKDAFSLLKEGLKLSFGSIKDTFGGTVKSLGETLKGVNLTGFSNSMIGAIGGAVIGSKIGELFESEIAENAAMIGGAIGGAIAGPIGAVFGAAITGFVADIPIVGSALRSIFDLDDEATSRGIKDLGIDIQAFGGLEGFFERTGGLAAFTHKGAGRGTTERTDAIRSDKGSEAMVTLVRQQVGATKEQAEDFVKILHMAGQTVRGEDVIVGPRMVDKMQSSVEEVLSIFEQLGFDMVELLETGDKFGRILSFAGHRAGKGAGADAIGDGQQMYVTGSGAGTGDSTALHRALGEYSKGTISIGAGRTAANEHRVSTWAEQFAPMGSAIWNNVVGLIKNNNADAADWLADQGYSITAKRGLNRVPGSVNQGTPAMLHGGERVLTNDQARAQDAGAAINVTFVINGMGDSGIMTLIRQQALPELQRSIENSLQKKARFGQFEMDSRAIRTVSEI